MSDKSIGARSIGARSGHRFDRSGEDRSDSKIDRDGGARRNSKIDVDRSNSRIDDRPLWKWIEPAVGTECIDVLVPA